MRVIDYLGRLIIWDTGLMMLVYAAIAWVFRRRLSRVMKLSGSGLYWCLA